MSKRESLIITKVKNNILENNLLEDGDNIVIGLSGGPDSVFLLYVLQYIKEEFEKKYGIKYNILVCHVNHMIRKEAGEDEKLAKEYASRYCLKFYSVRADIAAMAKEKKISEEECGRDFRYEFFNKIAKENGCNKIAVAHNSCDNAETILHNLFRGTGLNGLVGIKLQNGNIIRPILNIKKQNIINYLDENGIKYNIDRTNSENIYTRNKIRNDLLPKIEKEYNPNIIDSLNRMSRQISEDVEYINSVASKEYVSRVIEKKDEYITLDIKNFKEEYKAIKNRIVILFIEDFLGTSKGIENIHIENICDMFEKSITHKKFSIGNKFDIIIEKGKIAKIQKNNVD